MSSLGSDHDNLTVSSINLPAPNNLHDAGIRAADRIRERSLKAKAAKAFFLVVSLLTTTLLLVVSGTGYYGYKTMVTGNVRNERPCSLEVGKRTIEGKREYSHRFYQIFGFQFVKAGEISEKTTIDVRGEPFSVIGHLAVPDERTGKNWWAVRIGMGERGVQILPSAETYTFVFDDAIQVVPYRGLCR